MFMTARSIDDLNVYRINAKTVPTMIGGLVVWCACLALMI